MKVAHVAIVTPGQCGLYESARELVAAERRLGIDARIVDPKPNAKFATGPHDRGVPIADMAWGVTADAVVSHSGHDRTPIADTDQPIIVVAHGRPISTFILERDGSAPAYTYHTVRSRLDRYKACVTFWPEYAPYFATMWGGKPVHVVPSFVDLDYWSPGETVYNFADKAGVVNVVMTDPWVRKDVSLLPMVHAFALFLRVVPGARLHIFALDGNVRGFSAIRRMLGDSLGVVQGWAQDLRSVYRAADMLITPHRIYTRSIRESMACGCEVVSGRDVHPEDIPLFAGIMARRVKARRDTRGMAESRFSPDVAGGAMAKILESCVRQEAVA